MAKHHLTLALPIAILSGALVLAVDRSETPFSVDRLANGDVEIQVSGFLSRHYRIEASDDLLGWKGRVILQGLGSLKHTIAAESAPATRFFRVREITGRAAMTGDVIETDEGDVVVRPINHASFVMHWNGVTIYNDPVGSSSLYRGLPMPDLILVSHQHGDHYSPNTLNAVKEENTVIITPDSVFSQLSSALKGVTTVMANGESMDLLGVKVEAVPSYNSRHPKGRDNGYVVTLGGKRFYMSGDTEDIAEMRALPNIEVAFLAMNLPFTMGVDQAASALLDFKPKIVYPYHYRNQDGTFANLTKLRTMVGEAPEIEVRLGAWY